MEVRNPRNCLSDNDVHMLLSRIFSIVLILIVYKGAWGQNLVPNPSFEKFKCSRVDTTLGYLSYEQLSIYSWEQIVKQGEIQVPDMLYPLWFYGYSPDINSKLYPYQYYCLGEKEAPFTDLYDFGIPQPYSGLLMMGQTSISSSRLIPTTPITNLKSTLQKDSIYKIEFFLLSTPYTYYTADDFGWYFSPQKVDTTEWDMRIDEYLNPFYAIYRSPKGLRLDEISEWTKLTACYKAHGGEKSLYFAFDIASDKDSFLISYPYSENMEKSFEKFLNTAPEWVKWVGSFDEFIYYLDSVSVRKVSYPTTIRDTISFCTENPVWQLDSTRIKNGEILCSYGLEYSWNDGEESLYRTFPDSGLYVLHTTSNCGEHTFRFTIQEKQCKESVYIPTAFTPNSDGINDVFRPLGLNFTPISLNIYDRWGALIFHGTESNIAWHGMYKSQRVPTGVYTYKFKYRTAEGKIKLETGTITVLR